MYLNKASLPIAVNGKLQGTLNSKKKMNIYTSICMFDRVHESEARAEAGLVLEKRRAHEQIHTVDDIYIYMCVYVYVYVYIYIQMCIYTGIPYTYVCIYVCMHTQI